jgi:hypothetical protein
MSHKYVLHQRSFEVSQIVIKKYLSRLVKLYTGWFTNSVWFIYKNIIRYFDTFDWHYCFIFLKPDYYDHKMLFKLKNSEVFYGRVICVAGIKALNQTLFVNHPVYLWITLYIYICKKWQRKEELCLSAVRSVYTGWIGRKGRNSMSVFTR